MLDYRFCCVWQNAHILSLLGYTEYCKPGLFLCRIYCDRESPGIAFVSPNENYACCNPAETFYGVRPKRTGPPAQTENIPVLFFFERLN